MKWQVFRDTIYETEESSFCGVMITITFGASIAVWFMKTSVISDYTV